MKIPYKIYDIYGQEHKTLNNKRAQFSISLQAAIFLNSSAVKPVEVRVTWSTIIKRRTVESNIRQMLGFVKMSRLKPTIFALNTKIFFTYSREKIIFTVTYIKINADNSQEKAPYLFDN